MSASRTSNFAHKDRAGLFKLRYLLELMILLTSLPLRFQSASGSRYQRAQRSQKKPFRYRFPTGVPDKTAYSLSLLSPI